MDTETLLAMLVSLLDDSIVPDQATLLYVLAESDGDVQKAAQRLSESAQARVCLKRKRTVSLDKWLRTSPTKALDSDTAGGRIPKPLSTGAHKATKRTAHSQFTAPLRTPATHNRDTPPMSCVARPSTSVSDGEIHDGKGEAPSKPETDFARKGRDITRDEFMSLLRPPDSKEGQKRPAQLPPLTLATPSLVTQHTPCTFHTSVLPPELACRLFYTMLNLSENWRRNKWWLFDRVVESPHRTSFYVRREEFSTTKGPSDMQEEAQYWYNGRQVGPPDPFPAAMEEACVIVEKIVNMEMRERERFPLEWAGEPMQDKDGSAENVLWRANVAAANCYEGAQESVGPHSDQLTNLGPYPTIASLSLGEQDLPPARGHTH